MAKLGVVLWTYAQRLFGVRRSVARIRDLLIVKSASAFGCSCFVICSLSGSCHYGCSDWGSLKIASVHYVCTAYDNALEYWVGPSLDEQTQTKHTCCFVDVRFSMACFGVMGGWRNAHFASSKPRI